MKTILYQGGAYFEYNGKNFFPVKSAFRPGYERDFVYVEVRKYEDDTTTDAILSVEVCVEGKIVVDSKSVMKSYVNDADHIRKGIEEFDKTLKTHPANRAKARVKDDEDDLPF